MAATLCVFRQRFWRNTSKCWNAKQAFCLPSWHWMSSQTIPIRSLLIHGIISMLSKQTLTITNLWTAPLPQMRSSLSQTTITMKNSSNWNSLRLKPSSWMPPCLLCCKWPFEKDGRFCKIAFIFSHQQSWQSKHPCSIIATRMIHIYMPSIISVFPYPIPISVLFVQHCRNVTYYLSS